MSKEIAFNPDDVTWLPAQPVTDAEKKRARLFILRMMKEARKRAK